MQNKEKINESKREYYSQNKEKYLEYKKKYRLENKEKLKKYQRELLIKKNIEKNVNYIPPPQIRSWKNTQLLRDYFESIIPLLHITHFSDWYRISKPQIINLKGTTSVY